jgi:hypothetical protein
MRTFSVRKKILADIESEVHFLCAREASLTKHVCTRYLKSAWSPFLFEIQFFCGCVVSPKTDVVLIETPTRLIEKVSRAENLELEFGHSLKKQRCH